MVTTEPSEQEIRAQLAELRLAALAVATRPPESDVMAMDYHAKYLPSKLWAKIKRRVLKRDSKTCQSCRGRGGIVHHRSYEREVLEGHSDHLLATVCEGCHNIIHYLDDGTKRPEADWDAVLLAGQHQTHTPEAQIDLRLGRQPLPPEWGRMTAKQRDLWVMRTDIRKWEKKTAKGHERAAETLQMLRDRAAKLGA